MLKVIKQGQVVCTDEVFVISDQEAPKVWDETSELSEDPAGEAEENAPPLPVEPPPPPKPDADEISRKILQSAGAEREKILDQAREDAERIRDQARREGRQEAIDQWTGEVKRTLSEVESLLDQLRTQQTEYFAQYQKQLHHLAVDISEKILGKSVAEHEDEMKALIAQAVSGIRNVDWISVEVSDRLPGVVRWLETELAAQSSVKRIEAAARDLPLDACIIRTPEGSVDASVSTQFENLRNLLSKMDEGEMVC